MRVRWIVLSTALPLLFACRAAEPTPVAAPPSAAPPPTTDAPPVTSPPEEAPPEGGKLVGSGTPPGDPPPGAARCSVQDSNGPLEGGTSTQSGCADGEFCFCLAQAGYSCSGYCVRDGAWVVREAP